MSQTRRLAAILAADVAGYSRLIGDDEEGTLDRLRSIRAEVIDPSIAEQRGRVVKTTGDGLLVEFSSVVDALRCAAQWQHGMHERNAAAPDHNRIEFRIGVHQGDIVVEGDDIFGDGVNVAARLESLAEPGGICVSARVQEDVAGRLDLTFDDLGEHNLKNIARRVRVYRVRLLTAEDAPKLIPTETGPALALPDKPSIAVLPFQNMSGDPDQDYFADGMVEEIITALSRIRWLFVIARNSSFTYKGQTVHVKQVARELGVRYVLEGSVRKAGNRVRITGQLIDALTGTHLWADRFDGSLEDVFELQDQVASGVIGAIEPKLLRSEIERAVRKPTENLDAYDLYLRALEKLYKYTDEGMRDAVALMKRALAIDPSSGPATAMITWCRMSQKVQGWGLVPQADLAEGIRLARAAIEIGKDDPDTLWMAGWSISFLCAEHALGGGMIDRALTLNPNSAHAWMAKGYVSCYQNQPGAAFGAFQRAMRLSPLDPLGYLFNHGLGLAHLATGRYEEAMEWVDRSLREQPRMTSCLAIRLCAALNLAASRRLAGGSGICWSFSRD